MNIAYALIVAGGKGTRIPAPVPKQFLELNGKPVLLHTIEAFLKYASEIKIILVLPQDDFAIWEDIRSKFNIKNQMLVVAGGESRFQSVRNGLAKIEGDGLVAIHDGVRPLVSNAVIAESFRLAAIDQCAIASVPLKESIRSIEKNGSRAADRSKFRIIQTPQTFDVKLIKEAYKIEEKDHLTDDASVAEAAGFRVSLFEGSYENLKITTEEDLVIAAALLKKIEPVT